ncbi:MAG: FAD-binding oxidoreductase [Acidobacteriota bacterium]|nr:FAD-binding oxidoreductase [Acidobacteriota bacterium]
MFGSPQDLLLTLRQVVGDDGVKSDIDVLRRYGRDETEDLCFLPDAVVRPRSTGDVAKVLELASRHRVPVTPRGGGTGLSGGALPVHGGWILSLERLDRIRRVDDRNLLVEVEAGVVTGTLQRHLEEQKLFYPPDPASHERCMIGGNIAEDSAGPRSCKYGSTRRWVLGLEAVLADGRILRIGGDNRKDVAGYDLAQLLIGSEGSLAVVTAATLRLVPLPPARLTLALPFADLEAAASSVTEIFRRGHNPAACEILERRALEAVGTIEPLPRGLDALEALLLLELDGRDAESLIDDARRIADDLAGDMAGEPIVAIDASDQRRLWRIRDRVGEAVKGLSAYKEADTVVPRSALAELVHAARRAASEQGLEAVCYGHAGDGNLHVNLLKGSLSEEAWTRRRDAAESQLFAAVIALGGSISGEHGIGWTQRRFLPLLRSDALIDVMRRLKEAFDPVGILNPGKIFIEPNPRRPR